MAKIHICDICETRDNVVRRQYAYDSQPDGAGGSETIYEIYDLCQTHELAVLKLAIKFCIKERHIKHIQNDYAFNRLIIVEIKKMISQAQSL